MAKIKVATENNVKETDEIWRNPCLDCEDYDKETGICNTKGTCGIQWTVM